MTGRLSSSIEEALTSLAPVPSAAAVRTTDLEDVECCELESAAPDRVREFVTARMCAQQALSALGLSAGRVGRTAQGEPVWPFGFRGSLSHCEGVRAALVVAASSGVNVGIDIESHRPLPIGVRERALTPGEHEQQTDERLDVVTFSAKEAAFKAWFPPTRTWLDFLDVEVSWRTLHFVVTGAADGPVAGEQLACGRAKVVGNYVVTVAHVDW